MGEEKKKQILHFVQDDTRRGWSLVPARTEGSRERRRERWALRAGFLSGAGTPDPLGGVAGCSDVAELAREEGFIARKTSDGEPFFVAALLKMTTKEGAMQNLKVEAGMARELQSRGWRVQRRHSGEWRSQGRRRKANGNGSRERRRER